MPQSTAALTPAAAGRFLYTAQAYIPEVGLYYYKARFYSPTLGRFLQADPIGYNDGINWYNYVGGDPVNKADPSGLCAPPATPACVVIAEEVITKGVAAATAVYIWITSDKKPAATEEKPKVEKAKERKGDTVSESRRRSGTIPCTGCGARHGGVTGTTDCPDCDGKRANGEPIPGTPKPLPESPIPKHDPVPVRKPLPKPIPKPDPTPTPKRDNNGRSF
ncbi:MAG: hypothetical protein C0429_11370 [Sphingopyxis sp.]|nr:hypothetical protein [Sphingopyxis sp.]